MHYTSNLHNFIILSKNYSFCFLTNEYTDPQTINWKFYVSVKEIKFKYLDCICLWKNINLYIVNIVKKDCSIKLITKQIIL